MSSIQGFGPSIYAAMAKPKLLLLTWRNWKVVELARNDEEGKTEIDSFILSHRPYEYIDIGVCI